MDQEITITIKHGTGVVEVDAVGFKGKGCKALADALSKGGRVIKHTNKVEMFEGSPQGAHVNAGG